MVPDRMYVMSREFTGKTRWKIKPRWLLNGLLGPKTTLEIEVKITRGWMNPFNKSTVEDFVWKRTALTGSEVMFAGSEIAIAC